MTVYRHDSHISLFCWLDPTLLFAVQCNGSVPGALKAPRGLFRVVGVTLSCVSLPQSQGDSSKNSVVSSNSTKDSSMSSSAPMVPQFFYFIFSPSPSHVAFYCIISIFLLKFSSVSSSVFFFFYFPPHVE